MGDDVGDVASDAPIDRANDSDAGGDADRPLFLLAGTYDHGTSHLADVDGDGVLDLVLPGATTSVWRGKGDGTFATTPVTTAVTATGIPAGLSNSIAPYFHSVMGNLNGDKFADLFIISHVPVVSGAAANCETETANEVCVSATFVLLGKADGTFQLPMYDGLNQPGVWVPWAPGDFNGDTQDDVLAVRNRTTSQTVQSKNLYAYSAGVEREWLVDSSVYMSSTATFSPSGVGDVDGDGKLDFVVQADEVPVSGGLSQRTFWFGGLGNLTFSPPQGSDGDGVLEEIDGDGKPDLVVTTSPFPSPTTVQIRWNHGSGTFIAGPMLAVGDPTQSADLDGDGKLDLWSAGTTLALKRGDGSRGFGPTVSVPSVKALSSLTIAKDVNGDGAIDLVMCGATSTAVYLSTAKGLTSPPSP